MATQTQTTRVYRETSPSDGKTVYREEKVIGDAAVSYSYRQNIVSRIIYYLLDVLEVFLAFRLLFKALGANAANGFVSFMYDVTTPFVAPFRGIIASSNIN